MSDNSPKVTVYITAHNYGTYLREAIESVLRQSFRDWELIVIDDASSDHTPEVLRDYARDPRIRVVRNEENRGLPASSNLAVRMSRGEYVIRLDADDYFDENALLILSNTLDQRPDVGLVYPDYYHVNEAGEILELIRRKKLHEEVQVLDIPAHGAGTMIRKGCLEELNGYREIVRCQDGYDLWIRFIDRFQVVNVNLPLFYYRRHGQNLTEDVERILHARRVVKRTYVKEKYGDEMPKALGIIPVRGKVTPQGPFALRALGGRPLLSYTVEEAQAAEALDRVVLVTEDPDVARFGIECGVEILLRPETLARPNVPIEPTVFYVLNKLAEKGYVPEAVVLLHMNSPLKKSEHINEAVDTLLIFKTDSVVAVCEDRMFHYQHRETGLKPLHEKRQLRMEKDALFAENGALYATLREKVSPENFLGQRIGHIVMTQESSVHIDREYDFWLAEKILERQQEGMVLERP